MDITIIAGIILLGLLIIMVEIFFLPGTTLFGIVGGIILAIGIVLGYAEHGAKTGSIILGVTTGVSVVMLYAGFKTYSSGKMALKDVIDSKAPIDEAQLAVIGDEGLTISALRPNGKATFQGKKLEVYSLGEYIDINQQVVVVKIAENKIFVKARA